MIYSLFLASGGLFDPIAKPLAAVLAFFYSLVPDYGLAIVLLTIAMMIVLTPLTIKQTRSMLVMQKLQPEMKKLQEIHKNDRQALNEAVMALYKEHNASPLGGCLPMLLPFPLFIALLRVLEGLSHTVHKGALVVAEPKYLTAHTRMYKDIVAAHGQLDAFGMNLAKSARNAGGGFVHSLPYFVLLLLMVGTQFYQQYQLTSKNPAAKSQPGQAAMMKFIPLFFGLISLNFPAGVVLYWTVSNLIRVGQQWALYRYDPKVKALVTKDVKEIEAKTREIEAKHTKATGGRGRFRDLLSNATEAAADRRSPGGKSAAKPGTKPAGGGSGAAGKAGRTPPGKATTGTSGAAAKSLRPGTPAGSKGPGNQKGSPQKPGAPKGAGPKAGPIKQGGAKPGAPKAGGAPAGGAKPGAKPGGGAKPGAKPAGAGAGGAKQGGPKPSGGGGGAVGGGAKPGGGIQKAAPAQAKSSVPPEGADAVETQAPAVPVPSPPTPTAAAPIPAAAPAQPVTPTPAAASPAPVASATPAAASPAPVASATPEAAPPTPVPAPPAPVAATAQPLPAPAPEPGGGTNGAAKAAATGGNGTGTPSGNGGAGAGEATTSPDGSGNGTPAKGRTGGGSARNVNTRRRRKGR